MSKAPPPIPPKPSFQPVVRVPPPASPPKSSTPSLISTSSNPIPPPRPSASSTSPIRSKLSSQPNASTSVVSSSSPPIIPPRPASATSSSSSPLRCAHSAPPPPAPTDAESESRNSLVGMFSSLFGSSSAAATLSNTVSASPTLPARPSKSTHISELSGTTVSSSIDTTTRAPPTLPPRISQRSSDQSSPPQAPAKPNNNNKSISSSANNSLANSRNTSRSSTPVTKSSSTITAAVHATTAVLSDSPSQPHANQPQQEYEELYAGSEHIDDTFYGDDFTAKAINKSNDTKHKPMVGQVKVEKKNINILSTIALTADYEKPVTVDMVREGVLTKINSDGSENMYHFTLTHALLVYTEFMNIGNPDKLRVYEISKLMAFENEDDYDDDPLSFRLLTKDKSWRMRCTTIKEKQDWFNDIVKIASEKQKAEPGGRVWREVDLAPLFEQKSSVSACQLCQRGFGFMGLGAARHHCRNCGKVVCDLCSRERVRIERLDDKALMKVCSACARELKNTRKYGK